MFENTFRRIYKYLSALYTLYSIHLSGEEMIQIAYEAESEYVGDFCGKVDQSYEVYCKKDHLLYLDTQDGSYGLIPKAENMRLLKSWFSSQDWSTILLPQNLTCG